MGSRATASHGGKGSAVTEPTLQSVDGLSPRQEQAIIALLNEPTVKQAAATSNIGERTIYKWLRNAAFVREYMRARRQAFSQAVSLTQRYAPMAVQTLGKIMVDASAPHAARVSAAACLLKFSRDSLELDDLAARLETIEEKLQVKTLGARGGRGTPADPIEFDTGGEEEVDP